MQPAAPDRPSRLFDGSRMIHTSGDKSATVPCQNRERVLVCQHHRLPLHLSVDLSEGRELCGRKGAMSEQSEALDLGCNGGRPCRQVRSKVQLVHLRGPRENVVSSAVPALPPRFRAKFDRLEIWLFFVAGTPT